MMAREQHIFEKMEIVQGNSPGYVRIVLYDKKGPAQKFEATREQLMAMGQMMCAIAGRLPSPGEQKRQSKGDRL